MAGIPVGTISPRQGDPIDFLLSWREVDTSTSHLGTEFGLAYYPRKNWTITGNYTYMSESGFDIEGALLDRS